MKYLFLVFCLCLFGCADKESKKTPSLYEQVEKNFKDITEEQRKNRESSRTWREKTLKEKPVSPLGKALVAALDDQGGWRWCHQDKQGNMVRSGSGDGIEKGRIRFIKEIIYFSRLEGEIYRYHFYVDGKPVFDICEPPHDRGIIIAKFDVLLDRLTEEKRKKERVEQDRKDKEENKMIAESLEGK